MKKAENYVYLLYNKIIGICLCVNSYKILKKADNKKGGKNHENHYEWLQYLQR